MPDAEAEAILHSRRVRAEAKALQARPDYRDLMRDIAQANLDLTKDSDHLGRVLRDRGSYLIGMVALSFYSTTGELTAGVLANFCAESGICSSGRAMALVAHLRDLGELLPETEGPAGRGQRLKPGAALVGLYRDNFYTNLRGLSAVDARGAEGMALLDNGGTHALLNQLLISLAAAGEDFRTSPETPLYLFTEHEGALAMIQDFVASGARGNRPVLDRVFVSVSALARRHRVSRPHVLKLFKDAQARDLLTWNAQERLLVFTPSLSAVYEESLALVFANLLVSVEDLRAQEPRS
ncbi:MAG TPA: hypothetical protein VGN05_11190 [Parvibaculum sp.]|jgi:hypothetical protein